MVWVKTVGKDMVRIRNGQLNRIWIRLIGPRNHDIDWAHISLARFLSFDLLKWSVYSYSGKLFQEVIPIITLNVSFEETQDLILILIPIFFLILNPSDTLHLSFHSNHQSRVWIHHGQRYTGKIGKLLHYYIVLDCPYKREQKTWVFMSNTTRLCILLVK